MSQSRVPESLRRLCAKVTGGLVKDHVRFGSKESKELGYRMYDSFLSRFHNGYATQRHGMLTNVFRSNSIRVSSFSKRVKKKSSPPSAPFSGSSSSNSGGKSATESASVAARINHVSYRSLGLTVLTGAGLWWYYESMEKDRMAKAALKAAKEAKVAGTAAIGGDFELIESGTRKPFCRDDLKGKFSLLYFGFTHCPDVCPDELEKISSAVDIINKEGGNGNITPVFITLDPERDGVKQVDAYVKEFHPLMIGLTGSKEAITKVTKAYRVYFTKAGVGEMTGNQNNSEDYLIDHSIITYLLDPEGEFVTFFGKNYTDREMATSIMEIIKSWKSH